VQGLGALGLGCVAHGPSLELVEVTRRSGSSECRSMASALPSEATLCRA
jgi:hypothetical protein